MADLDETVRGDMRFGDDAEVPYEPVITGSVMVERVARAIAGTQADTISRHTGAPVWMAFKDYARSAIRAMREPTTAMEAAFNRACDEHGQVLGRYGYKVMIDAALAETAAPVATKARGQTEPVPSSSVSPVGEEGKED